jgi:hypothetical protein
VLPNDTTERENRKRLNSKSTSSRSVSFNPNIIETSFGGTQKVAKIKQNLNDSRSILSDDSDASNCEPVIEETSSLEIGNTSDIKNSPKSRRTKSFPSGNVGAMSGRNQNLTPVRRLGSNAQAVGTPECFKSVETPNRRLNSKDSMRRSSSMLYPEDFDGDSCGVTVAVRVRPFSKR